MGRGRSANRNWPARLWSGCRPEAIVLADGNFGIFAFAYAVRQTQRPLCSRRAGGKRPWGVRERAGADPDPKCGDAYAAKPLALEALKMFTG